MGHVFPAGNMAKLEVLRLFVNERLTAAVDDIFQVFSVTIKDYEEQVYRLKHVIDGRAADLQISSSEEQQASGRSVTVYSDIKQEEGGASGAQETCTKFTQCPNWLMEISKDDCTSLSNQIHSCSAEQPSEPQSTGNKVWSGKLEVEEPEPSYQEPADLQNFTTEEQQQHIKQEEGRASGPQEADTWLVVRNNNEESQSQNQVQTYLTGKVSPSPSRIQTHLREELLSDLPVTSQPAMRIIVHPVHHTDSTLIQSGELHSSELCTDYSSNAVAGEAPKEPQRNRRSGGLHGNHARSTQRKFSRTQTRSFLCKVCEGYFYTQGHLIRHAMNHCKQLERRCGACGETLESTESLRTHLRFHKEIGSTCDFCGKKCGSIKRMEIHKRIHTGEKPYSCTFCGRDFNRKESLERHAMVHSGERPYSCSVCRRTFTRRNYLLSHLKNHTETHSRAAGPTEADPFIYTF
ncbi:zinc finger protein 583-like [Thalassophryne amazonica]|uniref:zinc finger protein 583-like n=1 Tax=Thalassophryne amazonica TaxID=390379 RepID=UPI001470B353|nr:zinc finger protein 583-like [Thalassophryne amazonica]